MNRRLIRLFFIICLIVYLILLIKLIILKFPDTMISAMLNGWSIQGVIRSIRAANIIPFRTIFNSLFNAQLVVELPTLIYNILAFVPLGILLPLISDKARNWRVVLLVGVIVSLSLEVIQLVTLLGEADIDDVILNVTGTLIGYGVFAMAQKIVGLNFRYRDGS
jgi:glycopeptide antibiotics resistance protein